MQKQLKKFIFKSIVSISAILVIIISVGIVKINFLEKKPVTAPPIINSSEGIIIAKIELPKDTTAAMDMIGLIVYQGRVYTQTGTKIRAESAESLLGEKLGTTKGTIDEWSKQDDYAVEFASTIGKDDVYAVKGYDKSFRIMTYKRINETIFSEFYECFNGITVNTGFDIFSKLKIVNNIKTAKYENFESWNYNKQQYNELTMLDALTNLVNELKNTIPYTQESLSYLWDDKGELNQKFIYITLKDGSEVQLRLFKNGYIYYNCSHIIFKIEHPAFNELWNQLT